MIYSGLRLLLGVSSSIAAYRALDIASSVVKGGGEVRAIMTPNATCLVAPAAFEAITGNRVVSSLWESAAPGEMDHLAATKWANVFAIAPATAATIARLAHGLADDALSTLAVAWPRPLVVAPAMNPTMFQHATVRQNLETLRSRGDLIVGPDQGATACGDVGIGRLAMVDDILISIVDCLRENREFPDLRGKNVLITSGPTREFADPARCLTNPATGRMGVALARQALRAGARVRVVSGPCELNFPPGLASLDLIVTAEQMRDTVLEHLPKSDAVIFAAAVSDWRPAEPATRKAKKEGAPEELTMRLIRTPDVAGSAAEHRLPGQVFVGFAAESHDLAKHAKDKLVRKGFDFVVANPITEADSGFGTETNRALIVTADKVRELPLQTKDRLSVEILRELAQRLSHSTDGE
ncbi:bifunctional phosphopantothenoylcysteine decarboxylase/phosphopantothenate--cysteine ligase CoaBC [bacterium]|nr:bifunctional phosphopantothenoylcysteine decarboxylase/phosphopantothenate--cysteine ligase CoaBC [bacterium]